MTNDHDKHRQIDLATGAEVKRELHAEGITSYPAVCDQCHGSGKCGGDTCGNCNGRGSYELAV